MKRLYSYWTYPFVFHPFVFVVLITANVPSWYNYSIRSIVIAVILGLLFTGFTIFLMSQFKRVYLDDSTLYISGLFSRTTYEVDIAQLTELSRDNMHYIFFGIYTAKFLIDDGGYADVTFMKNKSIWNIRKYFE